jgi:hypothetical protein
MRTYRGVDVYIHVFMIPALVGDEWSASRPCRFTPGERAPVTHWIGGSVDPGVGMDEMEKRKFLIPILGQTNPVHAPPSYFSKVHFNIILSHLRLGLLNLLSSGFSTDILYTHSLPCVLHVPSISSSNTIWRKVKIRLLNSLKVNLDRLLQNKYLRHNS